MEKGGWEEIEVCNKKGSKIMKGLVKRKERDDVHKRISIRGKWKEKKGKENGK